MVVLASKALADLFPLKTAKMLKNSLYRNNVIADIARLKRQRHKTWFYPGLWGRGTVFAKTGNSPPLRIFVTY